MSLPQLSALGLSSPVAAAAAVPLPISSFSTTGVPGLAGGYAYPPGSDMTKFMDNINQTVAAADQGPGGVSVVDWANGLAAQAAQRKAAAAANPLAALTSATGGTAGASSLPQMFQMLMSLIASLKSQGTTAQ